MVIMDIGITMDLNVSLSGNFTPYLTQLTINFLLLHLIHIKKYTENIKKTC